MAREHDIPEVLPAAFYDLSRVYTFDSPTYDFCHRELDLNSLPPKDLIVLIRGMAQLRKHITFSQTLYVQPNLDISACTFRGVGGPSCQEAIVHTWKKNHMFVCSAGDTLLRLEGLREMLNHLVEGVIPVAPGRTRALVCSRCCAQAIMNIQLWRERIWSLLPAVFEVVRLTEHSRLATLTHEFLGTTAW